MSRAPLHDEVVQDSEDEDFMILESPRDTVNSVLSLPPNNKQSDATVSSIQAADFTGKAAEAGSTTDISSFTNNTIGVIPSISSVSSSSKPAAAISRPRPRPAYKGAAAKDSSASGSASGKAVTGAAQPTPSTSENSATAAGSNSIVDDDDLLPVGVAERAKLRPRISSAKAKSSAYTPADNVIEIPSSDSEVNLRPPVRATKRKPQSVQQKNSPLAKKRSKATLPSIDFSDPMSIPVPTSDFPMNLSSQLPPSDPPSTASGPRSTPLDVVVPTDGTLSPLSTASPVMMRKRKRATPAAWDEGGVELDALERTGEIAIPPPPPPFFASSSSSSVPGSDTLVEDSPLKDKSVTGKLRISPVKGKGKKKAVVDEEEDWTEELAQKPKARPKAKPRKKSGNDDEEEWDGDDAPKAPRKTSKKKGGSDDEEDEWTNDRPSKAKSKTAPKKKKNVTQKMSVVLDQPKAGRNTKRKAASKSSKPPTSNELIEDSDDERDNTLMPPPDSIPSHAAHLAEGPSTTNDDDELLLRAPLAKHVNKKTPSSGPAPSSQGSLETSNVAGGLGGEDTSPPATKNKGKKRAVVMSDDEDEDNAVAVPSGSPSKKARTGRGPRKSAPAALEQHTEVQEDVDNPSSSAKENMQTPLRNHSTSSSAFKPPLPASASKFSNSNRSYSIASGKSTPMSELIRRVNSLPGSPFASPRPTYSPYLKSSKSVLKRIAPLHPNRRTPPPPPPRPPPPKKSKKQVELEEKWELELEESIDGWFCLPEDDRAALRRAKRDAEMGFED